jgi:hypothetical protein
VDFFGSPGLLPSRSVGVSPIPTTAVFPRMLIKNFFSLVIEQYFSSSDLSSYLAESIVIDTGVITVG